MRIQFSTLLPTDKSLGFEREPLPGKFICPRDQRRAANPQMYHSDGLKILNLDLRGQGRDRDLKAGLNFSGSNEMWKAVRPSCSLNVLIWNAAQK